MESPSDSFGEPEEWHLDYPWDILQTGYWLWAMSGYQTLPHPDDVMRYPKDWITDMKLMRNIAGHQTNQRPEQKLIDDVVAKEKILAESDMSKYIDGQEEQPKKKRRGNKPIFLNAFEKRSAGE